MAYFYTHILSKLITEAKQNKDNGMISLFLIGCYPNIGGNPLHENPPIVDYIEKNLDIPYMMVLIDPYYDNGYIPNYLQDCPQHNGIYYYGKRRVIIYKNQLTDKEYTSIVTLCNSLSYMNCASYIADFTGTNKHITTSNSAVYITPFNCLADVTKIGYNPIIKIENKIIYFMKTHTMEDIYYENKKLLGKNKYVSNFNKRLQFINWSIIRIINNLSRSHLNILSKIKNKDDLMYSYIKKEYIKPVYNKTSDIYEESIRHLLYRCQGYDLKLIKLVISKWLYSSYKSLEKYINKQILENIEYINKINYDYTKTELNKYLVNKDNTYKQVFYRIINDFQY